MNRVSPQSIPMYRNIARALAAAVVLLALLPLLTRGADAVAGPTIGVTITDSSPTTIYEPGRKAAFGIAVSNTSSVPVTVTAATESLDGSPEYDISMVHGDVISTTCDDDNEDGNIVGTVLAPGDDPYECSFIVFVLGDAGDVLTDTVTVTAQDSGGNVTSDQDQRSYEIQDAPPSIDVSMAADLASVTEPGADVTYTPTVENTSPESVTITAATGSLDGSSTYDLGTVSGPILQTTCNDAVGTVLDPDDTYDCSFKVRVSGMAGDVTTNTVTFTVQENEGNSTNGQAAKTFVLDTSSGVWGVNSVARIYTYTGPAWQRVPGGLVQVDVGGQGEVWGVNSVDMIYRYAGNNRWSRIPGRMSQVSVGTNADGSPLVVGVNSVGYVYRYRFDVQRWTRLAGRLAQVEVGSKGEVWGVNSVDRIYRLAGSHWTRIPGGMSQVSVGSNADGSPLVVGVNSVGYVYRYRFDVQRWTRLAGRLAQVDVGNRGEVWGVNSVDRIYRLAGSHWTRIPGGLSQVSVGTR